MGLLPVPPVPAGGGGKSERLEVRRRYSAALLLVASIDTYLREMVKAGRFIDEAARHINYNSTFVEFPLSSCVLMNLILSCLSG